MDDYVEQTLVLIKPDAMARGLADEIISRFTRVGLKVVKEKEFTALREVAEKHYPGDDEAWLRKVGGNTVSDCQKYGIDVKATMGTDDPLEIGKLVFGWNVEFLVSGPMKGYVLEGVNAIEAVRKLVGSTIPLLSPAGTIRGDYSTASAISENADKKPIRNLVHASGDRDEAKREIELWFG